ncbi:hypothetical protein [Haloarcula nitratireducens]|uniref:DUF1440 domain-containing protein n=1 Tax=Haloarcula nitratireducens TaxID=2487749 RepID=A0AAW4PAH7_9EURY|nr:hypothetical protein [Halomicroarcula nitratireducens]MBX0294962.1 hypothetical protein [Halomicroarcula nitratireducens]
MEITDLIRTGSVTEPTDEETNDSERLTPGRAALLGVKGGLIATAVMTLYRLPLFRALPPTAEFWAKYVGSGEADEYFAESLLLHFLYGAVGGGLFGVGFGRFGFDGEDERLRGGLVTGFVYSLLMSVFGTKVVFPFVLDESIEYDEKLVFHVGHAIYGLSLGTWLGSRNAFGEVYD